MNFQVAASVKLKLREKHNLSVEEVREVFEDERLVRRRLKRNRKTQSVSYRYVGRNRSGRLLRVIIIIKGDGTWLMSAYDGDNGDFKFYNRG